MTSSRFNLTEEDESKKPLNFSIEHILSKAGNREISSSGREECLIPGGNLPFVPLPWLHCTRYCPPKIPRNQRRDTPQKRQLGRHPRIPFTTRQLTVLEEKFKQTPYLSSQEVKEISKNLDLADIRVKIWFQNRRARERREKSFQKEGTNDKKELEATASISRNHTVTSSPSVAFEIDGFHGEQNQLCEQQFRYIQNRDINDILFIPEK